MITDEQFKYEYNNVKEFERLNPLFTENNDKYKALSGTIISLSNLTNYREMIHVRSIIADTVSGSTPRFCDDGVIIETRN